MDKSLKRFLTRYSLILGEHGANELEIHVLTSHEHFADLKNILCSLKKLESILPSGNWITQKDSRMDWLLIYIVFFCVSYISMVPEYPRDFQGRATFLEQSGPCPAALGNPLWVNSPSSPSHEHTAYQPQTKILIHL